MLLIGDCRSASDGSDPLEAWMGLVLRRGFTLVGVGATFGGLVAAAVAVILSGITYGVSPADPLAWSGALAVVAGVSIVAHVVPARKAARVDPVQALSAE